MTYQARLQAAAFLVVVGSASVTPFAWGQGPLSRLTGFFGGGPAPVRQHQFGPSDQPRYSEIEVEVAWLSDPVTAPYELSAQTAGTALQVQGTVPSQAVRQRALWIAKKHTSLGVLDGLTVHPGAARPLSPPPGNVYAIATDTLRQSVPHLAPNLRVHCGNNGSISVSGVASNYEERLAISQALRRVPGCSSVINTVEVDTRYGRGVPQQQAHDSRGRFNNLSTPPVLKNAFTRLGFNQGQQPQVPVHNTPDPRQAPQTGRTQPPRPSSADHAYRPTAPATPAGGTNWRTSQPVQAQSTAHTTRVIAGNQQGQTPQQRAPVSDSENVYPVIARSEAPVRQRTEPPLYGGPTAPSDTSVEPPLPAAPPVSDAKAPRLSPQQLRQRIHAVCGNSVRQVSVERTTAGKLAIGIQLAEGAQEKQVVDRVFAMPELVSSMEHLELTIEPSMPPTAEPQIVPQGAPRR